MFTELKKLLILFIINKKGAPTTGAPNHFKTALKRIAFRLRKKHLLLMKMNIYIYYDLLLQLNYKKHSLQLY